MKLVYVSAVLLSSTFLRLFAQPTPNPPLISVIASVENVSGNVIHARAGAQFVTLYVECETEVWKGKTFHDLSPLDAGDEITARCRRDASGKLVAVSIWANIINFFGDITKVDGDRIAVLANPNADPHSGYRKEDKIVLVDADTIFDSSGKEDLQAGRGVQVVGLDLRNGRIQATRLTVYEGNRPVPMGSGTILPRTTPQ